MVSPLRWISERSVSTGTWNAAAELIVSAIIELVISMFFNSMVSKFRFAVTFKYARGDNRFQFQRFFYSDGYLVLWMV